MALPQLAGFDQRSDARQCEARVFHFFRLALLRCFVFQDDVGKPFGELRIVQFILKGGDGLAELFRNLENYPAVAVASEFFTAS